MTYFSRRNEYLVEFSGHEEVSEAFRSRLKAILTKFVGRNSLYGRVGRFVDQGAFLHKVGLEFPSRDINSIVDHGKFHEVFTVIEIFLEMAVDLEYSRGMSAKAETADAFELSGSVYKLAGDYRVELQIDTDTAQKVETLKEILRPFPDFYDRFFQAVGNLLGRRAKPEDVVKDIFIAAEGYLKRVTSTTRFGEAIKKLEKQKKIGKEQKKVLEALNEFGSDAEGVRHAGNSETPNEQTALWFVDTMISQLRMVDRVSK